MYRSKHTNKPMSEANIHKLILQREKDDVNTMRRVFCHHNLDNSTKTDFSKVYVISCGLNKGHAPHIVPAGLIDETRHEMRTSAAAFFRRIAEANGFTKSNLKTTRNHVNNEYLNKNNEHIRGFTNYLLVDKEVSIYLKQRSSIGSTNKVVLSKPKKKSKKKSNKKQLVMICSVEDLGNDAYKVVTPNQTQVLNTLQIKEFFSCESKLVYLSVQEAITSESAKSDRGMSTYLCVFCTGYHLGHKNSDAEPLPFEPVGKFTYRYSSKPLLGEKYLNKVRHFAAQEKYTIY